MIMIWLLGLWMDLEENTKSFFIRFGILFYMSAKNEYYWT